MPRRKQKPAAGLPPRQANETPPDRKPWCACGQHLLVARRSVLGVRNLYGFVRFLYGFARKSADLCAWKAGKTAVSNVSNRFAETMMSLHFRSPSRFDPPAGRVMGRKPALPRNNPNASTIPPDRQSSTAPWPVRKWTSPWAVRCRWKRRPWRQKRWNFSVTTARPAALQDGEEVAAVDDGVGVGGRFRRAAGRRAELLVEGGLRRAVRRGGWRRRGRGRL